MIVQVGMLLACLAMVLAQVGPAAAAPTPQPTPPQRILLVGDSTAETVYPYLRDAGAAHGVEVFSAAVLGCGVIDGQPVLDNGHPYVDTVGDTRRCAGTTESAQGRILDTQHPDLIVWLSGWESWPNRVLDGQLVQFGTIRGNRAILAHIDASAARLAAGGARLVFMPVAPNAYPSVRGFPNPPGDARLVQLAKLLRSYVRQHSERASLIDLPTILCPNGGTCPGEIAPGIRPRNLDGFHFDGDGAVWLAEQIMGMLLGTTRPPTSPEPPVCAEASLGTGLLTTRGGKCA